MAILLSQAYQLARIRLASTPSSVLRMILQRDHAVIQHEFQRRETEIFRAHRQSLSPHRRPDYCPKERLAILQLMRLRNWNFKKTARRFVVHPNTIRSWIKAAEGRGRVSLLADAIPWNRIDDAVRWSIHQLRRLCPEPELGTRTPRSSSAPLRHRAEPIFGTAASCASPGRCPPQPRRPAMALPVRRKARPPADAANRQPCLAHGPGAKSACSGSASPLRSFSTASPRKILGVRVYRQTPPTRQLAILVRGRRRPAWLARLPHHRSRVPSSALCSAIAMKKLHIRAMSADASGLLSQLARSNGVSAPSRIWWRLVLTSDKTACSPAAGWKISGTGITTTGPTVLCAG